MLLLNISNIYCSSQLTCYQFHSDFIVIVFQVYQMFFLYYYIRIYLSEVGKKSLFSSFQVKVFPGYWEIFSGYSNVILFTCQDDILISDMKQYTIFKDKGNSITLHLDTQTTSIPFLGYFIKLLTMYTFLSLLIPAALFILEFFCIQFKRYLLLRNWTFLSSALERIRELGS